MLLETAIEKIGFIGTGNMAQAMIRSILSRNILKPSNIFAFDTDSEKIEKLKHETGINALENSRGVINETKIVFLTIKPNIYANVLEEVYPFLTDDHVLISVAAGVTAQFIRDKVQNKCKIVRTMPNIATLAGEGMTAICSNHGMTDLEAKSVFNILSSFGKTEIVSEEVIDAVTAVSGSSPAFVFMFIEALSDSAVMLGIPRDQAFRLAAQTVYGSAKLFLNSNQHPGVLKDLVCTPGGTTIQGVYNLELNGFRGIIMDAVQATALKAFRMTNENS